MYSSDWYHDLACPSCLGELHSQTETLACRQCGTFPVRFGVPILCSGVHVEKHGTVPDPAFLEAMSNFLEINGQATAEVGECFRLKFGFKDQLLQAEADQFLTRLRNSGISLPLPYPDDIKSTPKEGVATATSLGINLHWLVLPKKFLTNASRSLSIILFNGTAETLSSETAPFRISYFFEKEGQRLEGIRTPLLIDLKPGRRTTLPIVLKTPYEAGNYVLRVMPILEGISWLEKYAISANVTVVEDEGAGDPFEVDWKQEFTPENYDYYMDPARGVTLCREWIAKHIATSEPKLLEVGGNFHPRAMYMSGLRYNVDIDPFSLMAYNIKMKSRGDVNDIRNIVANGMQVPFREEFFDAIIMFATFHHFSDPIGLLKQLRGKLRADGVLLLMCEPIGHVFSEQGSGDFLSELKRGVYEQSFMPWEYREMLDLAGFEIVEAALDPGSLKLAAKKKANYL